LVDINNHFLHLLSSRVRVQCAHENVSCHFVYFFPGKTTLSSFKGDDLKFGKMLERLIGSS